jgi:8-hydroxy-5-deazaflavin:NADPH oxidoreductase
MKDLRGNESGKSVISSTNSSTQKIMKIAILGETKLALHLGNTFLNRSMDVVYGVAENFELNDIHWRLSNPYATERFLSYKEAIEKADILFLCCDNDRYKEVCQLIGASQNPSLCIVDCTNSYYPKGSNYNITMLKKNAGTAKVFKAFNNLGLDYPGNDPLGLIKETYYCGEDVEEKQLLKKLISQAGFNPIDAGDFDSAILLEAFYHLKMKISSLHSERAGFDFKLISL